MNTLISLVIICRAEGTLANLYRAVWETHR